MNDKNTVQLRVIKNRTDELYISLTNIWESSVKATHSFLTGDEIEKIKLYVPQALKTVKILVIAEENKQPVAFMGVNDCKIEMLFVLPEKRGQGIGKRLITFAADNLSANEVTVNEQNPQAAGFYEHMGFSTYKRTDLDEQGAPYPLLYMRLNK